MKFSVPAEAVRTEMAATPPDRRPLPRRFARSLLFVFAALLAAAAANVVGLWLMSDVKSWSAWLHEHTGLFAAWRGILYAITAFGWWWMRGRVLRRESNVEARARLHRTEIGALLTVAALEMATLLQTR